MDSACIPHGVFQQSRHGGEGLDFLSLRIEQLQCSTHLAADVQAGLASSSFICIDHVGTVEPPAYPSPQVAATNLERRRERSLPVESSYTCNHMHHTGSLGIHSLRSQQWRIWGRVRRDGPTGRRRSLSAKAEGEAMVSRDRSHDQQHL